MRILITGASGLIGKALQRSYSEKGYEMLLAGRGEPKHENQILWTVEDGFRKEDLPRLEGLDGVVHLAGEGIAGLRWTEEKKKAIRDSRVDGTRNLVNALAGLKQKPKVFIAGSALGFYGDRGDDVMTETSSPGDTFLAEVCREWETESRRAEDLGIRTVLLRTGIVLSKDGGALATMMTPFKFGVGGSIGSGKQWMSWISLQDLVDAILFFITTPGLSGPVNAVTPYPVTNDEFTHTLARVLGRPAFFAVPRAALQLAFGEMADAALLAGQRMTPERLRREHFDFRYPRLEGALRAALETHG